MTDNDVDPNCAVFRVATAIKGADESLVMRVADAVSEKGFVANPVGRGSSGIEAVAIVSRHRVSVSIVCTLHEEGSSVAVWHNPPWSWRRILGLTAPDDVVRKELRLVAQALREVLMAEPAVSDVRWMTLKEWAHSGT